MRTRFLLQTALVLAATLGGVPGLGTIDSGALGITSAEARVYTRKRVNGRWVTGHFVSNRGSKAKVKSARTSRSKKYARLVEEPDETPAPEPRPKSVKAPEPALAVAAPAAAAVIATDDRMLKLQEALREKARTLAKAVSGDSPALDSNLSPQATGSVRPAAALEPRSVSFDFQSGVKTTVFSNGTLVEEKFDIPSLKGLAAPSPAPQGAPATPPLQATSALQASPSLQPGASATGSVRRNLQ